MMRASGILLHPGSLPGKWGIGDLGNEAYRFVDFLKSSGQHLWQTLPLGPPGYGNSPYQSHSVFAGNPLFISLEKLAEAGFLSPDDLKKAPIFPEHEIDYDTVTNFKIPLLHYSFHLFEERASPGQKEEFEYFCRQNGGWLDTFATYMAIKEAHHLTAWNSWEPDIRENESPVIKEWQYRLADGIRLHKFLQFQFFKQWQGLKKYSHENGVRLIGDMPIFPAMDSAEVWSHPEMFFLDDGSRPVVVAGVPPDYFSSTGQLWGNPLYRWDVMKTDGYKWWKERLKSALSFFDIVRIDHFRGFEKYWAVPAGDKTAENGRWEPGPGAGLFEALQSELGCLPIIAEDLGYITPEVEALRDKFGLQGMRVLQFAFSGDPKENIHLPHLHKANCVVYTGTHDNTTATGWFRMEDLDETTQNPEARINETRRALEYMGSDGDEINWDFIRLAMESVADTAIIPLQDILGLGNEARMNTPGTMSANWRWRFCRSMLTEEMGERLRQITLLAGR